jgi:hypothetical protein
MAIITLFTKLYMAAIEAKRSAFTLQPFPHTECIP